MVMIFTLIVRQDPGVCHSEAERRWSSVEGWRRIGRLSRRQFDETLMKGFVG
jgi:hypothetical protein